MSNKHILHSLNKYMFTDNVINNTNMHRPVNDFKKNINSVIGDKSNIKSKSKSKVEIFITPEYNDKLFWCFYIIKFGFERYQDVNNKHFTIETSFKMNVAEELKKNESLLKKHKIKRCIVESELINDKCITLTSLYAMCLVYKINVIYLCKRTFIKLVGNPDTDLIMNVIKKDEKDCIGIMQQINSDYIKNITDNFYEQVNYQKPIMSISAYKMPDINDIANKLLISLVSDLGKKKTKNILYQEILSNL